MAVESDVKDTNIKDKEKGEEMIKLTNIFCEICKIQFAKKKAFQNHNKKHDQRSFSCLNCGKQFFGLHAFHSHMRNYQLFTCEVCGKNRPLTNKVKHVKNCIDKQEKIKPENEQYTCNFCPFNTHRNQNLKGHIASKHTKIFCSNCNELFDNKANLRKHVMKNHPRPKKAPEVKHCKWPNCSFNSIHQKIFTRHENFNCSERLEESVSFIWY